MTTITHNPRQNVVKNLRKIRDQISDEIKNMTFEEERVYLDKLLSEAEKSSRNKKITTIGSNTAQQTINTAQIRTDR